MPIPPAETLQTQVLHKKNPQYFSIAMVKIQGTFTTHDHLEDAASIEGSVMDSQMSYLTESCDNLCVAVSLISINSGKCSELCEGAVIELLILIET